MKKIREQGTDNEAILFHFRKCCTGMSSLYTTLDRQTEKLNFIRPILKNTDLWNSCISQLSGKPA